MARIGTEWLVLSPAVIPACLRQAGREQAAEEGGPGCQTEHNEGTLAGITHAWPFPLAGMTTWQTRRSNEFDNERQNNGAGDQERAKLDD